MTPVAAADPVYDAGDSDYLNNRDHDPQLGRFISVDPRSPRRDVTDVVYINIDHWVRLAGRTLGLDDDKTVRQVADLESADSPLHAPAAGPYGQASATRSLSA